MNLRTFFIILGILSGLVGAAFSALAQSKNAGLGPLELRSQYPLTQPFLSMPPESAAPLPSGVVQYSYSLAVANTFVNTQGSTGQITQSTVDRGLTTDDFQDLQGNDVPGFGLYLDVESQRHTLQWKRGLGGSEISLEMPFVSYSGGFMDSNIEAVHELIGISNSSNSGAFRAYSARDRYAHYVIRDGSFLQANEEPVNLVSGEPVFGWKWGLTEGGDILPAISLKLAYKFAGTERSGNQALVRSGGADWGHMLLLAKRFDGWYVYLGDGLTRLGNPEGLEPMQQHRFMAMEYRFSDTYSFLFQQMSQSSIFPDTSANLYVPDTWGGGRQEQRNASLSVPSSVIMIGQKLVWGKLIWDAAIVQDYSNFGNEVDFVVYTKLGLQW